MINRFLIHITMQLLLKYPSGSIWSFWISRRNLW